MFVQQLLRDLLGSHAPDQDALSASTLSAENCHVATAKTKQFREHVDDSSIGCAIDWRRRNAHLQQATLYAINTGP